MMTRLKGRLVAAGLSAMLLLPLSAQAQEATFVLASSEVGVPSYNPLTAVYTNAAYGMIYDTLVVQAADMSFHPLLAQSWEEAPDGMAWTFHLKPGVTFHDGKPLTAQAVARYIELYRGAENGYMVDAIERAETPDDLTLHLVMKQPDPNILFNLSSIYIADPDTVEAQGADYGVTTAVGTGPFKLESFTQGQDTVVVRNDDYAWGSDISANAGPAHLARVTFREIPEDSTAFLELKSGGADALLSVPTDYLAEIGGDAALSVTAFPGQEVFYMPINVTKAPFTDIKLREAAALAINQGEILQNVFSGYGAEAHNFLISSLSESRIDPAYDIAYNPDRANQLLDEAGWVKGADGIREKDGQKLTVALWTQNDSVFRRLTEVVQAELKAVGFDPQIQTFDSSTIRDQYKAGEHQLAVRSYFWNNADIVDWFFGGDRLGYPNVSMFNDPKAEELRATAMTGSKTGAERIANFTAYHQYVTSQFAYAPIYQPPQNMAYNKDRLSFPAMVNATSINGMVMLDVDVKQ